ENVGDRKAVFLSDCHVNSRHQREVIGHVTLVAVAEIGVDVFRPLVGFGEEEFAGCVRIEFGPDFLDDRVGFRKILVVGSFALAQIRNGAQTEAIHAQIDPAAHDLNHGRKHARITLDFAVQCSPDHPWLAQHPGAATSKPCSAQARTKRRKSSSVPSSGCTASWPPSAEPMAYGLPGSPASQRSELLRPLRLTRPIGWMGVKYSTSKPIAAMSGKRLIQSSKVPCLPNTAD